MVRPCRDQLAVICTGVMLSVDPDHCRSAATTYYSAGMNRKHYGGHVSWCDKYTNRRGRHGQVRDVFGKCLDTINKAVCLGFGVVFVFVVARSILVVSFHVRVDKRFRLDLASLRVGRSVLLVDNNDILLHVATTWWASTV